MSSFSELYAKYAIPMDGMTVATEADDVTQMVARQMGGDRSPTNRASEDRTEDLTQTTDIFGNAHEGDEDPPPNTEDENNDELDDPDDNGSPEEGSDDSDSSGDEESGEDSTDPELSEETPEEETPESAYSDKNTLRDNAVYFSNVLRTDIDELTNALGELNSLDSIQVVNSVMTNLRNCKDILHKMLTEEMESASYEELMRKYITVKRIYDISIEMLDKHFSNIQKKPIRRKIRRVKIRV
ncbi:MAG: hypothetical protein NC548_05745 [Lachnospiraceae bacterium]|nr:hypothetical protein [Lachnospiraceae bacterium]